MEPSNLKRRHTPNGTPVDIVQHGACTVYFPTAWHRADPAFVCQALADASNDLENDISVETWGRFQAARRQALRLGVIGSGGTALCRLGFVSFVGGSVGIAESQDQMFSKGNPSSIADFNL
jgi:hypothetical protein